MEQDQLNMRDADNLKTELQKSCFCGVTNRLPPNNLVVFLLENEELTKQI